MTAASTAAARHPAVGSGRAWPVDLARYDRRPTMTAQELTAIKTLGFDLRRSRWRSNALNAEEWSMTTRLMRPLDDTMQALRWMPDTRHHRRSANDAIALVLLHGAAHDTAFWGWSSEEWLSLIGTSAQDFLQSWPGWLDGSVRPYVAAYAYLLCGFTDLHLLGSFNRVALAWRVFGRDAVDTAISDVSKVLGG